MQIIEAVPNFSEGQRMEVVDAIAAAVQQPGVRLLHRTSDWDHNRSVLTVAGEPEAVLAGLFRAVAVAAERIDLRQQRGVHPRLGATDVVPLVPLEGVPLDECVALARRLGRRIGDELGLPVYFYEAAASRPERRNLADVRAGEYERLAEEIHLPQRQPDCGPASVGPAGAVIVGARPFLIAFNVFLKSNDVTIAKRIARSIRESSGGLPAVKALGLLVNDQAQVSMNLVDFRITPPHAVVARIAAEARLLGVEIDHSELIGLLPQDALLAAAAHALGLPSLGADRVVEMALRRAIDAGIPDSL
ncbi:MAG: glutamate formimidoyltransferase [Chloroflexi bacterium]|nr:MAG: glutamate formimidoyltransferase [Chloroflexota bacterium]